jgi:hypothetical protein
MQKNERSILSSLVSPLIKTWKAPIKIFLFFLNQFKTEKQSMKPLFLSSVSSPVVWKRKYSPFFCFLSQVASLSFIGKNRKGTQQKVLSENPPFLSFSLKQILHLYAISSVKTEKGYSLLFSVYSVYRRKRGRNFSGSLTISVSSF